jgi:tubulin-like protein CetZ
VGADNELGAEIAEEYIDEVQGAIDNIPSTKSMRSS